MKLPHTKEVKIIVDYNNFEELVEEIYGHEYEFIADIEGCNDSSYNYNVSKEILSDYNLERLNKFKAMGKGMFLAKILLTDLANQNIIEEGNYLINVSW